VAAPVLVRVEEAMSAPTPRTDEADAWEREHSRLYRPGKVLEVARQLERELADVDRALKELAEANAELERRQAKIMRLSARPEVATTERDKILAEVVERLREEYLHEKTGTDSDNAYDSAVAYCIGAVIAMFSTPHLPDGSDMNPSPKEPT
jgi:hypothetical protein